MPASEKQTRRITQKEMALFILFQRFQRINEANGTFCIVFIR